MTQSLPSPPTGLTRLAFRAPLWLYRAGLGALLGRRFLLLNHLGRKSGLPRQAVLEVVDANPATDTYVIASGFGRRAAWYQNLQANPDVTIQVGRRRLAARAELLSPEASGAQMQAYARRNPRAAAGLMRLIGYEMDGSDGSFDALGRDHIPFVVLHPQRVLDERAGLSPLWLLPPLALFILVKWLRPQAPRPRQSSEGHDHAH